MRPDGELDEPCTNHRRRKRRGERGATGGLPPPRSPHVKIGNPPSGGPKLTERRTLPLGSRYITVGLLGLGIGTLTLTYNANVVT